MSGKGMAALAVVAPGASLLIEDLGRPGYGYLGVPPSGALDPVALGLANRLVGNPDTAAGLEVVLGGTRLVAQRSLRIALTGAPMRLTVGGRPQPWGEPVSVRAGHEIAVDPPGQGVRAWLAIAGGVVAEPVLGSVSTDLLTGLGPAPLAVGDLIGVGEPASDADCSAAAPGPPAAGDLRVCVRLGPRHDWITPASVERLLTTSYEVSPLSNRIGIRLEAADASVLERAIEGEMASEAMVRGSIQIPASGQPIVFLSDHPVTGGYPVAAVVDRPDLARCAQLRPGDRLSFTLSAAR